MPGTLPSKSLKKCLYTSTVLKLRSSKSYVVLKRFRIVNVARFARNVVKFNFFESDFWHKRAKKYIRTNAHPTPFLLKGNLVSQGSWSHVMTIALYGPWTFSVLYYYESPTSIYSSTAAGAHHKRERESQWARGDLYSKAECKRAFYSFVQWRLLSSSALNNYCCCSVTTLLTSY